jgi:hypothetical protein
MKTGSAARKCTLLAMANYADENGLGWASQETLARDTEQSVDSVQRHQKYFAAAGLIDRGRRPKVNGRWPGYWYRIRMRDPAISTEPQIAAWSKDQLRPDRAATGPITGPQAWRHEPSIEPPIEPSSAAKCELDALAPDLTTAVDQLRRLVGDDVFDSWFRCGRFRRAGEIRIEYAAPTRFIADTVRQRFSDQLRFIWPDFEIVVIHAATGTAKPAAIGANSEPIERNNGTKMEPLSVAVATETGAKREPVSTEATPAFGSSPPPKPMRADGAFATARKLCF